MKVKIKKQPKKKINNTILLRLPSAIFDRTFALSKRLSCNKSALIRMAIVKFLEEYGA